MKLNFYGKPQLITTAIAAGLAFPAFAFAADTAQLIGKYLDQNKDLVTSVMTGRNYMIQVDAQGKIQQVIDIGANGDGSDPSKAASGRAASSPTKAVGLPVNYQGQQAIDNLGADLAKVAQRHGLTPDKLKEMLLQDNTMRVDSNGQIFYVDHTADRQAHIQAASRVSPSKASGATNGTTPAVPIASSSALANAFLLHSKPGASKTIYLNFVGYKAENTAWSTSTIEAPAYDLTGNPAVFDDAERSDIIDIWNRVSEDYIPFDVDITTEPPSTDALIRTSAADTTYGTQVVITKTVIDCGCGGISYIGFFNFVNNSYYQPAWIFHDGLFNNVKYIAEGISHEVGHVLGLLHDGVKPYTEYYPGHGSGVTAWAPIMGVAYYNNITQWNPGTYPNANNQQDDIAIFATSGILPRQDDFGNTFTAASSLTNIGTPAALNIQTFGIIEQPSDIDMFVINTAGGNINLTASPATAGPNLDISLTLYNAKGGVVAADAPEAAMTANINRFVAAGTYYLAIADSGHAAVEGDAGYPTYGSLGQYQISGSYAAASPAKKPVAKISTSALSGPAPLTVNFSANNSIGNGNIVSYLWSFGDNSTSSSSNPSHTFNTVGTYTAKLTVTNQYQLTDSKTVQIAVKAPSLPMAWASKMLMTILKTGNGVQARTSVTVVDSNGKPIPNATITGTFSGSATGKVTGKTDAKGKLIQTASSKKRSGGSATYTLNSVTAAGHTYNPTKNARTVVTMSW